MANRSSVSMQYGQSRVNSKPPSSTDLQAVDSISLRTALTELALAPIRVLTSPKAFRAYASTALVVFAGFALYLIAVVAYILFYNAYIPDTSFTIPIHLQFDHLGHGGALDPAVYHPYAVAEFSDALRGVDIDANGGFISLLLGGRGFLGGKRRQRATGRMLSDLEYDIDIVMKLPRTPSNVAAGNFMLSLSLLDASSSTSTTSNTQRLAGSGSETAFSKPGLDPSAVILAQSSRPSTLTYASPFLAYVKQILTLPLYMLDLRSESEFVRKPMLERVAFPAASSSSAVYQGSTGVPHRLHLEVRSRERLQIYSICVEVRARFTGIRWLMSRHRIFSFLCFTSTFWGLEMVIAVLVWAGSALAFSSGIEAESTRSGGRNRRRNEVAVETESSGDGRGKATVKKEEDEDDPDLSETSRSFPTHSGQPPLRYSSPRIKREEEDNDDDDDDDKEMQGNTFRQGAGATGAGVGEADDEDEGHDNEDADFLLEEPSVAGPGGRTNRSGIAVGDFDSGIGSSMDSGSTADKSGATAIRRRRSDK